MYQILLRLVLFSRRMYLIRRGLLTAVLESVVYGIVQRLTCTFFGLVPNMKNSVAGLGVIQGNVLEVLAGKTGLDASAPYQVAEAGLGAPILG